MIPRADIIERRTAKMEHPGFKSDCTPLLRPGIEFDLRADQTLVDSLLLARLTGD